MALEQTQGGGGGVAILIGKNFDYKILAIEKDEVGNFISILLTMSDFSIKLVNIYMHQITIHHNFLNL